MKRLYFLTQNQNRGYDTFDSCIVCAESEDTAKLIPPETYHNGGFNCYNSWAESPDHVQCKLIGIADDSVELNSVVLSSFNAG